MGKDSGHQRTKLKSASVLEDAIAEYDSVLAGKVGDQAVASTSPEKRKGANPIRRKNVLGRGLSALMSANAVRVDPPEDGLVEDKGSGFEKVRGSLDNEAYLNAINSSQGARTAIEVFAGSKAETEPLEGGLVYLSVDRVKPNASQPRRRFNEDELNSLSASIAESGLLQPIIVRKLESGSGPLATYEIVAGERRWRAAKHCGLQKIPALLRHLNDKECLELGIIENVQRSDLNPIEEAQAYHRLIENFKATQVQIAKIVGRDRASIANALRLLKLPKPIQAALIEGSLSEGHGRVLLQVADPAQQRIFAEKVLSENMSVRALEREIRAATTETENVVTRPSKTKDRSRKLKTPGVAELEDRLRRALGTKVSLNIAQDSSGTLQISFYSEEELARLLERLDA